MTAPETLPDPDGRVIITREPPYTSVDATGKPIDKPKLVEGINQLLLADESTLFECAERDYRHQNITNVMRHKAKHTHQANRYPEDVIDTLMRYRELERSQGVRGASERTAARLNKEKVPTPSGIRWLASTVDAVAHRNRDWKPKAAPAQLDGQDPLTLADPMPEAFTIEEVAGRISELLDVMVTMAQNACPHSDYDELKNKATMLDQMRTWMGQGV